MTTAVSAQCPECRSPVDVSSGPMVAEIVICPHCSTELEVLQTAPVLLALAPEVEEDWGE